MPYFHNSNINILFIHIPKTGGVSVEIYFILKYKIPVTNKYLFGFLDEEIKINKSIDVNTILQHMTYKTIIKYNHFFNVDHNNLKIITIVRNPYERIISDLFFLNKINVNTTQDQVYEIIKDYIIDTSLDNHNIPQYLFLINDKEELIENLEILHTETLNEDMIKLGFTNFNYKFNCNNKYINYYEYLNNNSIKLINDFYHKDFEMFKYNKIFE